MSILQVVKKSKFCALSVGYVLLTSVSAQGSPSIEDRAIESLPSFKVHSIPTAKRARVYVNGTLHSITLHSIDVPYFSYDVFQLSQPYGYEAHMWVKNEMGWSDHGCRIDLGDAEGVNGDIRTRVYCPSRDGWYDLSHRMLELGLAWPQQGCSVSDSVITRAEQARVRHVGLWSGEDPLPPWVFRSRQGIVD